MRNFEKGWPVLRQVKNGDVFGLGQSATSTRTQALTARTKYADRVVDSVCPYCAVGCAQLVYVKNEKIIDIEGDPRSHPVWRDETAALMATRRLVRLARETGKRIHVLHISTKEEIEFLRDHKDVASCEATPHHLTMAAPECY